MNCYTNNCTPAPRQGNLVYLTKVFYDTEENSSPILTPLTTTAAAFTQQLNIGSSACGSAENTGFCGCGGRPATGGCCECDKICQIVCCCGNDGCSNVTVNASTTFDINNAYVITRSFDITTPTLPADLAVTVDGIAITDVTQSQGQYTGDISGIMSEISKCPCSSSRGDICPGHFVMVSATGPWSLTAVIVLEGTLYSGGNACHFRLCFTTADGTPLSVTGNPSFAICGAEIPCQVSNVAPSLHFDFDACASILNPALTANADGVITLTGSLVVTPQVKMRVTRPSLFDLNAREICLPCDNTGQCDPCDPCEKDCFSEADDCCCGHPSPNMVDGLLEEKCASETCGAGCRGQKTANPGAFSGITCQCCDINGYSF